MSKIDDELMECLRYNIDGVKEIDPHLPDTMVLLKVAVMCHLESAYEITRPSDDLQSALIDLERNFWKAVDAIALSESHD